MRPIPCTWLLVAALAMISSSNTARAALFCADSAAGIQFALTASEDNGQDDQIDIVSGSYTGGFVFNSSEANTLTIFGGYTAACAQLSAIPAILDGNAASRTLTVIMSSMLTSASLHIERMTFLDGKDTNGGGGGLLVSMQAGDVRLETNRFLLDHSTGFAGALLVDTNGLITLRNNLFYANSAPTMAAGELLTSNSVAYVTGNTILDNSASTTGGVGGLYVASNAGTHFWLSNNILWGNSANGGFDLATNAAVILLNNDIGTMSGVVADPLSQDNQSVAPDFAPCSGLFCHNYNLARSSPLVDAGVDNPPTGTGSVDLEGKPRVIGPHVDIGAYEQDVLFRDGFE
jgi:hypothetical protein